MSTLALVSPVTSSDTTLTVLGTIENSSGPGVVMIESELIAYSGSSTNQFLGCTRGYGGTTAASHAVDKIVTLTGLITQPETVPSEYIAETYVDVHSHQSDAADLTLSAKAGSGDGSNPKYLAASMWNIFGATLTRAANYLAGVIGAYSITGPKSTTYPAGAVLGQITDGVTEADGAFVAYIDGDSSVTTARAAFTVMSNNSNASSKFQVGLDLKGASHDGYQPVSFSVAEVRFSNGTYVTVSGDTIVFHNLGNTKTATITMA